jgi:hypothetical protein
VQAGRQELAIALLVRVVAVGGVGGCGSTSDPQAHTVPAVWGWRLLGLAKSSLVIMVAGTERAGPEADE